VNSAVGQQSAGLRNLSKLADSFLAAELIPFFTVLIVLIAKFFFILLVLCHRLTDWIPYRETTGLTNAVHSAVGQQSAGLRNFRMFADSALAAATRPFLALMLLIANCFFMIDQMTMLVGMINANQLE